MYDICSSYRTVPWNVLTTSRSERIIPKAAAKSLSTEESKVLPMLYIEKIHWCVSENVDYRHQTLLGQSLLMKLGQVSAIDVLKELDVW